MDRNKKHHHDDEKKAKKQQAAQARNQETQAQPQPVSDPKSTNSRVK